ncbi:hypothetical protein NliqN6_2460 [Naganishia liquefaciens]|uniref:EF-hand domain-containing protein n=1 Tax=Naganishia liquefaciens TaxID=104408 RepID=A0A8H3TSF8_9TREE|nr:hypothetical protein NliqN6_2460 [Naganishia liquefaciens]
MAQNLFGGLDRPSAQTSDSPFTIANNAMKDKSTPQAPKMKLPQSKAVAQAQHFAQQHQQQQQQHRPTYQQPSAAPPGGNSAGPSRHPGSAQEHGMNPNGLKSNARDAYMGAGAWNAQTGAYGPGGGQTNQPNRGVQTPQGQLSSEMRLSRSPSPYNSNPNFVAQQGFAQAVMMAQGGGQGGPSGPGNASGTGSGIYPAPSFPSHYQQQFANQTNPQNAPPYRQVSYPPPVAQNQQQMYTAPSPSQYGQPGYPTQPSPANSSQGFAQNTSHTSPYNNTQYHQQHQPSSSHAGQSQSPYADPLQYASPASAGLGSPAIIVNPDPNMHSPARAQNSTRPVPAAPAGTDVELWQMFSAMDIDQSGQLEANEVQALLAKDHRWANIEPREDCVKMLMNIFDTDRSGTINYVEFEGLYRYIKDWYNIFQQFDRDRSGTIDRRELEQALNSFGYPLPSDLVRKLEKRYAPPKAKNDTRPRGVTFDRFLMACVTVKHFTEAFRQRDVKKEGRLTVDYSTFMDLCLSSPA